MTEPMPSNVPNIYQALDYLGNVVTTRLDLYFKEEEKEGDPVEIPSPMIYDDDSPFTNFVQNRQPSFDEYIIFLMALAPHIRPDYFDTLFKTHLPNTGDFPRLGGVRNKQFRGFLPTGETALFILAGDDLNKRFEIQQLFSTEHWFYEKQVLYLEEVKKGEPTMSGRIILDAEYVELFTLGSISRPALSASFPAEYIDTQLEWEDLVLDASTLEQIIELKNWVQYNETLLLDWGMANKIKPGYRALFYGPPGTGKTLTATLLGKYTSRDVYRIDLSMIVSKFIGETEKNLSTLFDKAQDKNWILFFDEADALFGKRTNVRDAHDKYANQEVAYLLQRIEAYPGLVILASNFKSNIDEAFMRRFQSIIYFPTPSATERLHLWQKAFPNEVSLAPKIDLEQVANRYELTGSNIINVTQFSCLKALARQSNEISYQDLITGIRKELSKEGKVMN